MLRGGRLLSAENVSGVSWKACGKGEKSSYAALRYSMLIERRPSNDIGFESVIDLRDELECQSLEYH